MDKDLLVRTVSKLVMQPKGILAIDESINTCNGRFEKLGIPTTEEKEESTESFLFLLQELKTIFQAISLSMKQ